MHSAPWLLLLLATASATNGTETGSCDPDSTIFPLCDGWSIAAIVMFALLGLLIIARIITSYVHCDCSGGTGDDPPVPEVVVSAMPPAPSPRRPRSLRV